MNKPMRIKFEGFYKRALLEMATEANTTPTQILNQLIAQAHDAKDEDNGTTNS